MYKPFGQLILVPRDKAGREIKDQSKKWHNSRGEFYQQKYKFLKRIFIHARLFMNDLIYKF